MDNNKKSLLTNFVKFVKNELGIKNTPTIVVKKDRNGLKTTANYDYTKTDKVIKIYGGNRLLVDVMRSIGHELTHHKQWENGRLEVKPPDIGGPIEDEANAMAGRFIKMFAIENPTIYDE